MDDYGGALNEEAQLLSNALKKINTEQKTTFLHYIISVAMHEEESNEPPAAIAA